MRVIYKTNFTDDSDNFPMRVIHKTNFNNKCDMQNRPFLSEVKALNYLNIRRTCEQTMRVTRHGTQKMNPTQLRVHLAMLK